MSETAPEGSVDPTVPPSGTGCADCEAAGHPAGGCTCAAAPPAVTSAAATARRPSTRAPTPPPPGTASIQSFEPGEDWFWDYGDESIVDGPALAPPTSRPEDQPVPGPRGRVPADWRAHIH